MSTYADPSKAKLWLDGDMFRAPSGTALPADIFASSLVGWDAYGGIKAGFTVGQAQDTNALDIWNNESGAAYRIKKGNITPSVKVRPVDYSKATVLTLIRGGSIAETGVGTGIFEHIQGDDEKFATILRVQDGSSKKAYYIAKCELTQVPEEVLNDDDLEGWDLELTPLAPDGGGKAVRRFTNWNPLA